MGYDDAKSHRGRAYSGMRVGGRHEWEYPDGRWREQKVTPEQWSFDFASTKRRSRAAPAGSGAQDDTLFHWFILAHQRVRKVDANTYETFMEGSKWKVAHRRPTWRRWSSEYQARTPARERVLEILEDTAAGLREQNERGAPRLEARLDPRILRKAPVATLDAWADEGERV